MRPHSRSPGTSATRRPITWSASSEGIVGFRFTIEALEGKLKLSQNRSEADRGSVAAALSASSDPQARDVGAMMDSLHKR